MMGLSREQRLAKRSMAVEELPLSPQEFFVLSRVEGTPAVGEILAGSGLEVDEAERIIERLVELGALEVRDDEPQREAERGPRSSQPLRERVKERRREALRTQMASARVPWATRAVDEGQAPSSNPAPPAEPAVQRVTLEPAGPDDSRLDEALDIPVDEQRRILGLADRLDELTPFDLLGIVPTHDEKAIRRAFHETSRRLHPDAYFGRKMGIYRELLSALFHRAKRAYAQARDVEVRQPLVDAHIESRARLRRAEEQKAAARRALDDAKRKQEEAELEQRREARAARRAAAQKRRIVAAMQADAVRHRQEAEQAEQEGNLAKAANLYRLAMRADPDDEELKQRWQECLTKARSTRAADAFQKAIGYMDVGQSQEATKLFAEAADADPTPEHCAHAAEAIRLIDAVRAHGYAMTALQGLGPLPKDEELAGTRRKSWANRGLLHLMIARAFLAAGQSQSAREQATIAQKLRPGDPEVTRLLSAIKA